MATTELRRYEVAPGKMEEQLEGWRELMIVAAQYGFSVRFAFVDEEASQLVYAVTHDGDFDEAHRVYSASPERAAVRAKMGQYVEKAHLSRVRVEIEPS